MAKTTAEPGQYKSLIIAEKPSVAADIARAIGGFTKHEDYFESDDFVVSSAVGHLLEIAAPVIVYVSCNPATQARDLALLNAKYTVTKIQPVDMFPHTLHIENVVQLKRTDLLNA